MKLLHLLQYAWMDEYPAFHKRRSVVIPAHKASAEVQQAAITAAEAKRLRRAERNRKQKDPRHD